ncbi:hypothetical protein IJ103_04080 [Candidatus Saccharibacteria bacterium]|nr:hypothetical protein [Candidatus Saccharibacteria bacterium]
METIQTSLAPTESKKLNKATVLMAILMLLMLGVTITFIVLWANEKNKNDQAAAEPTVCDATTSENGTKDELRSDPDYLYIGQWGIKIKIPESLKNLHYSYRAAGKDRFSYSDGTLKIYDHESQITVGGTDGEGEGVAPEFASGNLGAVSRYEAGTYACEASCPTLAATIDNYEYYYVHPQTLVSTDQSDVEWETSSVNLIEQMLSNENNYAKF